jgi:predicted LPLAT superfamily acyltransferase
MASTPSSSERQESTPQWQRAGERSNAFAMRIIVWIALTCGRRISHGVLWPIAIYFWATAPAARRASAEYLRRVEQASGRPTKSLSTLRHFYTFAAVTLDRVFMLSGQTHRFHTRVQNFDSMRAVHEQKVGGIFVGAHFGSFEALRVLGTRDPATDIKLPELTVRMAMYAENAQKIMAMLEAINPEATQHIISLGSPDAMLQLQETVERAEFVGMLADRHLSDAACERVSFLGAPAQFPIGPFRVAMVLKRPVYLMFGIYHGGNEYEIVFDHLPMPGSTSPRDRAAQVRAWQAAYVSRVEHVCKQSPYNWFNFYDFWH